MPTTAEYLAQLARCEGELANIAVRERVAADFFRRRRKAIVATWHDAIKDLDSGPALSALSKAIRDISAERLAAQDARLYGAASATKG